MKMNKALWPILAGFFVMGFGGIIGTVMFQIKNECVSHVDQISYLIPIFAYLWFVVISIPTGLLCGRIGRKRTVLVSLFVTIAAMTGAGGGKFGELAGAAIKVQETETFKIQELHLPVYHALCAALEEALF